MERQIVEVKRHLDGRREEFPCQALSVSPQLAIVRYVTPEVREAGGYVFPTGSVTYGFFWAGRHYNLYRMLSPDGRLIAHRFDVVAEVQIGQERVEYQDLALDLWVNPNGEAQVEDKEELAVFEADGLLPRALETLVEETLAHLQQHYLEIIREGDRELARLVE